MATRPKSSTSTVGFDIVKVGGQSKEKGQTAFANVAVDVAIIGCCPLAFWFCIKKTDVAVFGLGLIFAQQLVDDGFDLGLFDTLCFFG